MNKYYTKVIELLEAELDELHSKSTGFKTRLCRLDAKKGFGLVMSKGVCMQGVTIRTLSNMLSTGEYEGYFHETQIVELLSDVIEVLPLKRSEIANIMLSFITDCPAHLEGEAIDYYKIYFNYFPPSVNTSHLMEATHGKYEPIAKAIEADTKLLSAVGTDGKNYIINLDKMNANISKIKENYSSIYDTFDEKNIIKVFGAFLELGVSLEVAEMILQELFNKLKKHKKENTSEPVVINKKVTEAKPSKYLSDKEYKELLKEVKRYYNPYTRKLTNEFISSEDRERIAAIMVRLGLEQYQVVDFLKKTETVSKTYTYEYFKDHVEEFEYYFGEDLSQVHEYMKEIESCTDDEDKEYWIMGINEELAKLENSYKLGSYEYETKLIKEQGAHNEEI